ncbi:MAG TPA: glycosyltransferase family 2 protein [Gemmataceae bacterium]|nr:glycosyltransferase family 2 protein [Gemmataceae bacterium]
MSDLFERSPIAQAPLSVILPADHVAAADLEKTVGEWNDYLGTLRRDYEILMVGAGSSDGTVEAAPLLESKYPRFRQLPHPPGQGIGAAIRTGLAAAQHPLLCYAECSSTYQAEDLARFLEVIDKVDVVSGFRVGQVSRLRHMGGRFAYRGLLRLLFGLRLSDVDCPFKLFRRSIFARIPIQSNGPFVHAEILAKANFLGCIMTEVPVRYEPNNGRGAKPSLPVSWRRDARRVFFYPDFGPPVLPEQPPPPP